MGSFELLALGQLIAFGAAVGLLLSVMLQPKRGRADSLFILFCMVLLGWSISALIVDRSVIAERLRIAFLLTGLAGTGLAYFLFVDRLMRVDNPLFRLLMDILPLVTFGVLTVIWTGSTQNLIVLAVLLGLLLVYSIITFWSILVSRAEVAPSLRWAGLLLVVACAAPSFDFENLETALVLMTAAALWTGWAVLRFQWQQPVKELQDELRVANADLRLAVAEVTHERARRTVLEYEQQRAVQIRTEFIEELGHRLRTPLNSISGYNQLLQVGTYGAVNERQSDRLTTIARNTHLLLATIHNMLELNALDAGRMGMRRTSVPVAALLEKVVLALEPQRAAKALRLDLIVPTDVSAICVDEVRIVQVLRILVENALKFTVHGSVTLRAMNVQVLHGLSSQFMLPVRGWLSDGLWVILSVEDSGIGIALEEQVNIFEPFHQLPNPDAAALVGSGLSLAVAKRMVEQHEGTIWLRSIPGQGSTFYVALQAARLDVISKAQS